jgi:pimeloyl-ACP methyl ester carboxylesterase
MNKVNNINRVVLIAVLLMASATLVNAQQKIDTMEKLKKSGYAPVNGLQMYYEIYGSGNMPLVLIHGGGSTLESSFGNIIPLVSGFVKVIAVELQAHGRTSDRDAPESFEQDADDVAALLTYLKMDKANFFGFSNGGTTTLQIAIRHPQMVNKIIVISANYKRDGMTPGFFDGMQHATLNDMPGLLKEAYLKVVHDKSKLQVMFDKDKERMLTFKDISDDLLQGIKAPTLLMSSDQDVIMPEHTVKMWRLIPGSRLAILPGAHGSAIGEIGTGQKSSKLIETTLALVEEFLHE